jgi:hypothetical protein
MKNRSPFSENYVAARERFRGAARALGLRQEKISLDVAGPEGCDLSIDVAFAGSEQPTRMVIVTSGLHGVEAFFGSAIQVDLLENILGRDGVPSGVSVLLVHALNPYGFSYVRRFDVENIDLNRNFLLRGEDYAGCPRRYADVDGWLNPKNAPRRFDPFPIRAALSVARYGMNEVKQAVAGGQYDYPLGLFFGGKGPSPTRNLLEEHLQRWAGRAERILHIDFHTGLGLWADYKLLLIGAMEERKARLAQFFGADKLESTVNDVAITNREMTGYQTRGDLITWCSKEVFGDRHYDGLAAEFGTYPPISVLAALRAENQAHHWGEAHSPSTTRAKSRLKEMFVPEDPAWRSSTVTQGSKIVQRAIEFVSKS